MSHTTPPGSDYAGSSRRPVEKVFSERDEQIGQREGWLMPVTGGFSMERSMFCRLLSRFLVGNLAASTTSNSSDVPSQDRTSWLIVPAELVSQQTLQYLGFTSGAAQTILSRFLAIDNDSMQMDGEHIASDELLKLAHFFIKDSEDCSGPEADWNQCLVEMGIDVELRSAMLHDDGDEIRFTRTCAEWVVEFVETRWLDLKVLIEQSHEGSQHAA